MQLSYTVYSGGGAISIWYYGKLILWQVDFLRIDLGLCGHWSCWSTPPATSRVADQTHAHKRFEARLRRHADKIELHLHSHLSPNYIYFNSTLTLDNRRSTREKAFLYLEISRVSNWCTALHHRNLLKLLGKLKLHCNSTRASKI